MLSSRFFLWFPIPHSLFRAFWDCSKCTNYNWYYCQHHVLQLVWQGWSTCLSFRLILFSLCGFSERQNLLDDKFVFFVVFVIWHYFFLLVGTRFGLWDLMVRLYLKTQENFMSHSLGRILVSLYTIYQYVQVLIPRTIPSGSCFPLNRA